VNAVLRHILFTSFSTVSPVQVVPKFLQPSGAILDSGGLVFSDGSGWQYGRDEPPNKAAYNYIRPTDYGSSYCTMVTAKSMHFCGVNCREFCTFFFHACFHVSLNFPY